MRRLNIHGYVTLVAAVAVITPSAAWAQFDQVYGAKGTPTKGTVVKMSPDVVTLNSTGVEREFAVNAIRKLSYADDPVELRRARDAVLAGRYANAIEDLQKINPADVGRDFVQQDISYYLAFCRAKLAVAGNGDKKASLTQLFNFVRNHPNNYHFYESARVLGDLAIATGDFESAAKYYAGLSRAPWPDYQLRASVLEAGALLAQKKYAEALKVYDQVLATDLGTAEANQQKQFANVGKAACLAATGKAQQGIAMIENVIATNDPLTNKELFARAYNALGSCYANTNQPKEALMAYLHTDLLYYADAEAHAEALYHLSKLWRAANDPNRARQAGSLLRTRYPGSVWASRD